MTFKQISGPAHSPPVGAPTDPRTFGLDCAAYPIRDTMRVCNFGRTTLYSFVKSGDLRLIKVGKKSLVGADDIAALLVKLRSAA